MQNDNEKQMPGRIAPGRMAPDRITMEEYLEKRRLAIQKSGPKESPQDSLLLQMKAAEWFFFNARPAADHRLDS